MSETLDAMKLGAIVLVAAVLQVTVLGGFDVRGGSPDLLLVVVVAVALLRGALTGATAGFLGGLIADTATLQMLGVTSLLLTVAGYWAGRYGETSSTPCARSSCTSCSGTRSALAASSAGACSGPSSRTCC